MEGRNYMKLLLAVDVLARYTDAMIVWLNGAHGAGKTTVAKAIVKS
jgi:tRNA A37 threonylcarbamoyladenosine biosynthesis protein TsaE